MRTVYGSSSRSLSGSLRVLCKKEFTSSVSSLAPRSFLLKEKGLEIKAERSLFPYPACGATLSCAGTWAFFLGCYEAQQEVAFLPHLPLVLMFETSKLLTQLVYLYGFMVPWVGGLGVSALDMVKSLSRMADNDRLSTSPLAVAFRILQTLVWNCDHMVWLLAEGHLICFFGTTLQELEVSTAWRDWALWDDSWPGSSCVSPESDPVCCSTFSRSVHFILAWCIFRPCRFLHTFPQT